MRTLRAKTLSLGEALGSVGAHAEVRNAFDLIEIAEEEIRAALRRTRESLEQVRVWNAFRALFPGPLSQYAPELYRHHVRELLGRAAAGEDLRPGTEAEVIAAVSRASLASRLERDVETLALDLSAAVFPALRGGDYSYTHAGAREETLAELRRRTRVDGRRMPDELRPVPPHAFG